MISNKKPSFEVVTLEEIASMPASEVPTAVDMCLADLTAVQSRVTKTLAAANAAKGLADKAKNIQLRWYKIGDKAKAIEALQESMVGVADAQGDQAKALKQLLIYQESVAKGMEFLLALGVANIANSRTVVKQL